MKTYIVMMDRKSNKDLDIRCRSDVDKHPSFIRNGGFVTYTKDNGTKIVYTVLYETTQKHIADSFVKHLKNIYVVENQGLRFE